MAESARVSGPTKLPAGRWKAAIMEVKDKWTEDHVGLISGGVAFFGLLALFPAITALVAIAGLVMEPGSLVEQMQGFSTVLPSAARDIIIGQAQNVAGSSGQGLGIGLAISLGLALYSASKGLASLVEGMNLAYNKRESRGFIRLLLENIALTVMLIVGLIVGLAAIIAVPAIVAFVGLGSVAEALLSLLRWPLLLVLTVVGLGVLYRTGPSRQPPPWRWVTPGALAGCILWLVGTALFAYYTGNFASYNQTFGALAGVIVLLMWLWVSAIAVLMGAEFDAALERQSGRAE